MKYIRTKLISIIILIPWSLSAQELFPIRNEESDGKPGLYRYIDIKGRIRIPGPFCAAGRFHDGIAVTAKVCRNPTSAQDRHNIELDFIDIQGRIKFSMRGDLFLDAPTPVYSYGLINIWQDSHCKYFDLSGKPGISAQFDDCREFEDGLAYVALNKRLFFIDTSGKEVEPFDFKFTYFEGCTQSICRFRLKKQSFFYDKKSQRRIPGSFDSIGEFSEDKAPVSKAGKWGFIDKTGRLIIPYKYGYANSFEGGMASVKKPNSEYYFFIDSRGKKLHKGYFNRAPWHEGSLFFSSRDRTGLCYYNQRFEPVLCERNLP